MLELANTSKTMSSLEIAELTGKEHKEVLRDIRKILSEAEIDERSFALTYTDGANREQPCYNLPKRECDLVVSGYTVKYRLAIIDRWQELEAQQSKPKTRLELARENVALIEEIEEKDKLLQLQAPAVAYVENFVKCDGLIGVREAAKSLGLQQNAFVQMLIGAKIMFRENGHLQSYQSNIDAGRFAVKVAQDADGKARSSTMLTAKGIRWVAQKLELDKLFAGD